MSDCLGMAVRSETGSFSVSQLKHVPLLGRAPGARTWKSKTNSCPQSSLLSRGNGSINNYFFQKLTKIKRNRAKSKGGEQFIKRDQERRGGGVNPSLEEGTAGL